MWTLRVFQSCRPHVKAPGLPPVFASGGSERHFGARREASKLKLRSRVARKFFEANPPKLQQKAKDHLVRRIKDYGNIDGAHELTVRTEDAVKQKDPTILTSEEKTRLLWRYVPDEVEAVNTLRKSSHKWMWRYLKKGDWRRFDTCLEQISARGLVFDEITYNMAIFGALLHPKRDDAEARMFFTKMAEERRFNPALLRLQGGFVESYFELKEVEAEPNHLNLRKLARTFWEISRNFKRQRVKETRRKLAELASRQRSEQLETGMQSNCLAINYKEDELSDGENRPRVKFPAKRPRQLKGVHKGSGVPNRRKHKWKH